MAVGFWRWVGCGLDVVEIGSGSGVEGYLRCLRSFEGVREVDYVVFDTGIFG